VARGEDRPDSDIDLLADLPPGMSLFGLERLQAELEAILLMRGSTWFQCRISSQTSARASRPTW
jgi:predicted nucleotidyltransferase